MDVAAPASTTAVVLGGGSYRYEVHEYWGRLPPDRELRDVAAVAVDSHDNVYVFDRGPHPVTVLDNDGNFLRSWGEGMFGRPHGLYMAPDDTLFCTDDGHSVVRKCTLEGKVLLTLGTPGKPAAYMSGRAFCRCTHTALSPQGDIYVTDGYGNSRVHKYSPDGRLLTSWGAPGCDPGQFNIPHAVVCDDAGWVYVADRENHRVQVFDGNGRYQTQWNNLHRPLSMFLTRGTCPLCYLSEVGPALYVNKDVPNLGSRIKIMSLDGKELARLGHTSGHGPGEFFMPHGIAVNSRGDIYVGELVLSGLQQTEPDRALPARCRALQKLVKLGN